MELERWQYAPGDGGKPYFLREARKAKVSETTASKFEAAMKRIEDGTARPQEFEHVRDGVYELRVDCDGRWYRIMYGEARGGYVALSLVLKKTNRLEKKDIATAVNRLKAFAKSK